MFLRSADPKALPNGSRDVVVDDDDDEIRWTFCEVLEAEGYRVRHAANGADALDRIRESPPCLVLLDMMMPVMGGAEVLAELERTQRLAELPVVVLSAQDASCLGARAVLRKPISLDQLLGVVER